MRGRMTHRKAERREAPVKRARMEKAKAGTRDLTRILEEWLKEARIRYTFSG